MFTSPKFILAALLLAAAPMVLAQDQPVTSTGTDPEWDLTALLDYALKHNPQLESVRQSAEAARFSASGLNTLANPRLQFTPGFSGSTSARDEEIIVAQQLDLFGQRRAQRKVLEAQSKAALASRNWTQVQVLTSLKSTAADLFYSQEKETLYKEQVDIARDFLQAANRRAELGDIPGVQAQRASLELTRAENDLTDATGQRLANQAALNALLGREPAAPLRLQANFTGTSLATSTFPQDLERLKQSLNSRPDVLQATAQAEASRAQAQSIRRDMLPLFELQGRRDRIVQNGGSAAFRASFNLPLFDFGSNRSARRAAEAQQKSQQAQAESLKIQAANQLEAAHIRLDTSRTRAERYRTQIVPQTLDLLRKTQIGFKQGASSYLEVLESQRTSRQIQNEYLTLLNTVATEAANLEAAAGAPSLISH